MAITAKFLADFEAFKASVQSAEGSLKSLEGQGAKLSSTFDNLKGIALGFAEGIVGAFTVDAVLRFSGQLFDAADALTRLHDQTGLSVEGLQRFQVAGDDAGNSIEEIAAAITKMEDRLAGGDKSAMAALEKLGLSFSDLKSLSPEDQFIAISDALRLMQDPAQQINVAIDLFGKQGATVLPVLKRGFDDVKGSAVGMSLETVKALDDIGDAYKRLERGAKGVAATMLGGFLQGVINPMHHVTELGDEIKRLTEAADKAAPKMAGLVPPGLPADLDEINKKFEEDAKLINEQMTPGAIAFRKAMEELNSAGLDWRGTLDTIDGAVVEAIKMYEAAGVSTKALADAYGLTDTQVRAVGSSVRAESEAVKDAAAEHDRMAKAAKDAATALEQEHLHMLQLRQETAKATAEIEKLKKANREMGGSTEYDLSSESGRAKVPENIRVWLHDGYSLAQAAQIAFLMSWGLPINANDPLFRNKGPRVPGFASGVQNFTGGLAMVGERGPELVNLPSGSDVIPFGRGGRGTGDTYNFYLVDNSENLARKTANLIMSTVKSGQKMGLA